MVNEEKCFKCPNYRVYYEVEKISNNEHYRPTFDQDRRCVHPSSLTRQIFLQLTNDTPIIKGLRLSEIKNCPIKEDKNE